MFIAFFPRDEARDLLDLHYEMRARADEIEAELGSSYFFSGASSWDAEVLAREEMLAAIAAFNATPEGALHNAKVEAAHFMTGAITGDMKIVDYTDHDGFAFVPTDGTCVPEYSPAYSRRDFSPAPTEDDIPF